MVRCQCGTQGANMTVSEEWGHRQNLNDLRRLPSLGNQVDSCMANLALMDPNENAYDLTGGDPAQELTLRVSSVCYGRDEWPRTVMWLC
jgi:hypothetical protein